MRPPIPPIQTSDIIHDLCNLYGQNLEQLTPQAKQQLMMICALATEFGWPAAIGEFFIGHSVPTEAIALAQNLDSKGLMTLIVMLGCALRCGDPLIVPEPKPTPWQRFVNWLRSFLPI